MSLRFYAFARGADDIADNPDLAPEDKIRRLDRFEEGLDGRPGVPAAIALRESLAETGVTDRHARDLLAAFRQDATKLRYRDWDDLLGYCELSANPVGRYLMDLHGEDPAMLGALGRALHRAADPQPPAGLPGSTTAGSTASTCRRTGWRGRGSTSRCSTAAPRRPACAACSTSASTAATR